MAFKEKAAIAAQVFMTGTAIAGLSFAAYRAMKSDAVADYTKDLLVNGGVGAIAATVAGSGAIAMAGVGMQDSGKRIYQDIGTHLPMMIAAGFTGGMVVGITKYDFGAMAQAMSSEVVGG